MICNDPWSRQVRYISSNKSNVHARAIRNLFLPLISAPTNEPPMRRRGIATGSLARGQGFCCRVEVSRRTELNRRQHETEIRA